MTFLDTETCGLHGMPVLLQYMEDDGPLQLWDIWTNEIRDTLALIDRICSGDVCGFNLAFDWFHLCKVYTTFSLCPDFGWYPIDHIDDIALLEEKARFSDWCLKPQRACDLMLLARKTHFQSLMNRDDIKIRRIPTALAWKLAKELEKRIKFEDILFARRKDKDAPRWQVYDIKDNKGNVNPDFKDIKLKFHASTALKNLAIHALGVDPKSVIKYTDIEVRKEYWPEEKGYAPFALAVGKPPYWRGDKGIAWPGVIKEHIIHWAYNERARKYAGDDVIRYTKPLYHFFGNPEPGDVDSNLACCVAAVRWKGYDINLPRIASLKTNAENKISKIPTDSKRVRAWLQESMDEEEMVVSFLKDSTRKKVLEEIAKWKSDPEEKIIHPAALKAQAILDARMAKKEIELYDKLLLAKRFHASFKVIGTLSNRMSGTDGLNPQAIKKDTYVREAFTLAENSPIHFTIQLSEGQIAVVEADAYSLCGGDFESFEVAIAEAVFACPSLRKALLSGKKIHAMFAMKLFPGKTYEEILASKGKKIDMYDTGKKGVFLIFYGGDGHTIVIKLGISEELANPAFESFYSDHPEIGQFQEQVQKDFGCLIQPKGIGSKVEWVEPKDFAEAGSGFRRYFTLENKICRELYNLAQDVPKEWRQVKIKVQRRDRIQTASGAVSSALYGAAFGIASRNVRAAKNHYIQSWGATLTKELQEEIWRLQPSGIHKFVVRPANVHDEFLCPTSLGMEAKVESIVRAKVEEYRKHIPLIEIDWESGMKHWAVKTYKMLKERTGDTLFSCDQCEVKWMGSDGTCPVCKTNAISRLAAAG